MTEEVLVDALPYFDSGYDEPGVKQAALALIEEECRRYRPTKNYLDFLGTANLHLFETEILKNEFSRLEQRIPMEMLSMKRYELPPPTSSKQTEVSAWNECVENSYAQLEHQANRILNLEIMSEYGSTAWRIYNQTLQTMFDESQKQLGEFKRQIQNVNLQRKNEQTTAGEKLKSLEQNWVGLVSKNYEIECAIVELEKELVELKRRKSLNVSISEIKVNETELTTQQTIEKNETQKQIEVEDTQQQMETIETQQNIETEDSQQEIEPVETPTIQDSATVETLTSQDSEPMNQE